MKFFSILPLQKLAFFFCLLTITPYALHKQPTYRFSSRIKYTPENTILAWDIHSVLVKSQKKEMLKSWWNSDHRFSLPLNFLNPWVMGSMIKLSWNKAETEEYVLGLPKKHQHLEKYIPFLMDMVNKQVPFEGMQSLIQDLCACGYKENMYILSNIGHHMYHGWSAEIDGTRYQAIGLKNKWPEIFSYFKDENVQTDSKKPGNAGYQRFKINHNKDNKYIIFIDDKMENIEAAQRNGIKGIHFTTAEQLRCDLRRLGILPDCRHTKQT